MASPASQPGFDRYPVEEFVEEFLEKLAVVESSIALLRDFLVKKARVTPLPCHICPVVKCPEDCKLLKKRIGGQCAGKVHGEGTINLNLDNVRNTDDSGDDSEDDDSDKLDQGKLKDIQKVCSVDVFGEYEQCWKIFSKKQWEVLVLCRRDGKNLTQIARELHKAVSTVWGLLHRAEKRKQKYYGKQS